MKARLVLITMLFLVALHTSSCFLKPKYHYIDHRGVYKDKGVTKDQLAYLEERKNMGRHGRHYKKHVKVYHLSEDHRAGKNVAQNK